MAKLKIYRQGDVLFVKVSKIQKKGLIKLNHGIIAEGEATGHKHELLGNTAVLFSEIGSYFGTDEIPINEIPMRLEAFAETRIIHNEHGALLLPKGKYIVVKQREYSDIDSELQGSNKFLKYNRTRLTRSVRYVRD